MPASSTDTSDVAPVGLRQPCPCGSGRRYKACHGRADGRRGTRVERVQRPLRGVPGECDWVALRELIPAGTASVRLSQHPAVQAYADRSVIVVSTLPAAWPALVRDDGTVLLGLQVASPTGDAGRDLAGGLLAALEAEPGGPVTHIDDATEVRIGELIDDSVPLDVTVHDNFAFWTDGIADDALVAAARERADEAVVPTVRLSSADAAFWCVIGERRHLRWVQPHDEDPLLDALARLHVAGDQLIIEGSRLLGSFRSCGLLVPVWDLPPQTEAADLEQPVQDFQKRLDAALSVDKPLTGAERGARAGLANRQLTLR